MVPLLSHSPYWPLSSSPILERLKAVCVCVCLQGTCAPTGLQQCGQSYKGWAPKSVRALVAVLVALRGTNAGQICLRKCCLHFWSCVFYKAQICINVTDEYFPRHPFYCAQGQQPLMGYFFLVCKVILDLMLRLWQNPHLLSLLRPLLRPFLPWPYSLGQHPILLKNCLVDWCFCHILHFYLIAFEIIAKLPAQCTNHFHFLSGFVVLRDVV